MPHTIDLTRFKFTAKSGQGFAAEIRDQTGLFVASVNLWSDAENTAVAQLFAASPLLFGAAQAALNWLPAESDEAHMLKEAINQATS